MGRKSRLVVAYISRSCKTGVLQPLTMAADHEHCIGGCSVSRERL